MTDVLIYLIIFGGFFGYLAISEYFNYKTRLLEEQTEKEISEIRKDIKEKELELLEEMTKLLKELKENCKN